MKVETFAEKEKNIRFRDMRLKIRQMIKLMSLGFIGLALLSCSKGDSEPEYQKPMSFSGYTARSATKANGSFVTGNALPSGQAFGVYAYNTGTEAEFDPTRVAPEEQGVVAYGKFMSDVKVTYNGGDASSETSYDYNPKRYWPNSKESNRLAFFAYYPYNGAGITRTGFADFSFTVQDSPASQVDFMLSDVVANQMYGATGSAHNRTDVVDLKFYHMLTQIKFKGIADVTGVPSDVNVSIKIKELKVVNVLNSGTLTPTLNVETEEPLWTLGNTTKDYSITLKNMNLPTDEAAFIAEDNQILLMIPQGLATDDDFVKLSVTYTITIPSPTNSSETQEIEQTAIIDLSKAKNKEDNNEIINAWTRNQQIVYTLKIGLRLIDFSADVTDWEDGANGSIGVE